MSYETALHSAYVVCMALGAAIFALWMRDRRGVPRIEYLVALVIPVWSGLAYLAVAFGMGKIAVDGQVTYWARYADWVVTTPLLLVALWMTGTYYLETKPRTLLLALVAADVVMILCGLVADLSTGAARFAFYAAGVAALVVVFAIVWGPLRRIAREQGDGLANAYGASALFLSAFWVGYPLTWLLGPSGLGVVGQGVDTLLFVLLPVFSKVGFSLLDLGQLRKLPAPAPEATHG